MTTTLSPITTDSNTTTRSTQNNSTPSNNIAASRTALDSVKAIPTTLNAEWIKLRSLRSNKAIIALTAAVGGFMTWAIATYVTDEVLTITEVFTAATVFTAVFAAVGGILLFTSESQHGTLAPALTAQPARAVIAVSKTVIAAGFGAVLGAVGLAAGYAGAYLGPIATGDTSTMLSTSLWAIGFASLASVLGLGIGMIARLSTAAVSGLLVWWLVVENLVGVFLAERFARFMPFTAGNGMLGSGGNGGPGEGVSELALTTTENALVFGGYAAVALVIGTVLLYRRDTN
ncbi:MAG: ABC transporter permease subunit [Acidimicrobiales bacterium]